MRTVSIDSRILLIQQQDKGNGENVSNDTQGNCRKSGRLKGLETLPAGRLEAPGWES